jgi:hypothetical protein
MASFQVMLVNVHRNYRLIMKQLMGDIQRRGRRKHAVIPGRRSGPRAARADATNPESRRRSPVLDSGFARRDKIDFVNFARGAPRNDDGVQERTTP